MPSEVTDPALLEQLEGAQEVTDPKLISQLEAPSSPATSAGPMILNGRPVSPVAQADPKSAYPVGSEIGAGLQNAWTAMGSFWPHLWHGAQQAYAQGKDYLKSTDEYPALQADEAERRKVDAPLMDTTGGKIGAAIPYAGLMTLPGGAGAAGLMGGALGALQPTVEGESRGLNAGIGGVSAAATSWLGNAAAKWADKRALLNITGMTPQMGGNAVARTMGAKDSSPESMRLAYTNMQNVFKAARDPNVTAPVNGSYNLVQGVTGRMNPKEADVIWKNPDIADLITHEGTGSATAKQLGDISHNLSDSAYNAGRAKEYATRDALYAVRNHVDELVGNSIQDPVLAQQYRLVKEPYHNMQQVIRNPNIYNASTGEFNLKNYGKMLQRKDPLGVLGNNQSAAYTAGRLAQGDNFGGKPPPLDISKNLGLPLIGYHLTHNPIARTTGGLMSRAIKPVAPALPRAMPGLLGLGAPAAQAWMQSVDAEQ